MPTLRSRTSGSTQGWLSRGRKRATSRALSAASRKRPPRRLISRRPPRPSGSLVPYPRRTPRNPSQHHPLLQSRDCCYCNFRATQTRRTPPPPRKPRPPLFGADPPPRNPRSPHGAAPPRGSAPPPQHGAAPPCGSAPPPPRRLHNRGRRPRPPLAPPPPRRPILPRRRPWRFSLQLQCPPRAPLQMPHLKRPPPSKPRLQPPR
mmetsp:Transcript_25747/g.65670  ORF Transcript_25747/g.65670 Transcript_25747/m.65670 type:complete len:204 (+) Transcript_25747:984-1595(+)